MKIVIIQIGKPKRKKNIRLKFDRVPTKQKVYPAIRTNFIIKLTSSRTKPFTDKKVYSSKQSLIEKTADNAKIAKAIGKSNCLILYSLLRVIIYKNINK